VSFKEALSELGSFDVAGPFLATLCDDDFTTDQHRTVDVEWTLQSV
jgi:hypothetical protein